MIQCKQLQYNRMYLVEWATFIAIAWMVAAGLTVFTYPSIWTLICPNQGQESPTDHNPPLHLHTGSGGGGVGGAHRSSWDGKWNVRMRNPPLLSTEDIFRKSHKSNTDLLKRSETRLLHRFQHLLLFTVFLLLFISEWMSKSNITGACVK